MSMYVLVLNDMRMSQVEIRVPVCRAESCEELEELLNRERVPDYVHDDGSKKWLKVYRQGGPLEWFNPPWPDEGPIRDVGTAADWMNDANQRYHSEVMTVRTLEDFVARTP